MNDRLVYKFMPPLRSSKSCSATSLDQLNLGCGEGGAAEACWQLIPVEEDTLGRQDGAQLGPGNAADARGVALDGLAEGAKLLGVVPVGAERRVRGALGEGGGKRVGWGCRVRVRCVVNRG